MITVKMEGYKEALRLFDPRIVDRAARMALNDTARRVRTESGKEIRKGWNVKAGKVNKELQNVRMARAGDLTAIIQAKGRPISLIYFGAKQVRRMKGGARISTGKVSKQVRRTKQASGVTVQIRKGQRTHLPNAFIATMNNGHTGVFQRAGGRSIVSKASITIASMFTQRPVLQIAMRSVNKHWPTRFNHHLERLHR